MPRKDETERTALFADMLAAMGTERRLRIVRLLLAAHPQGLVVGEIAGELGIANSTLSHHLDKLKQVAEAARQWHGHIGLDEDQFERDSGSRFARLLLAYKKAYFGDLSYRATFWFHGNRPSGSSQGRLARVRRSKRQCLSVRWYLS